MDGKNERIGGGEMNGSHVDRVMTEIEIKQQTGTNQGISLEKYLSHPKIRCFYYEWEDGTISAGYARNKMDAAIQLDEIGSAEPSRVKFFNSNSLFFTFKRIDEDPGESCDEEEYPYKAVCSDEMSEHIFGLLDDWANMKGKFNNRRTISYYGKNR